MRLQVLCIFDIDILFELNSSEADSTFKTAQFEMGGGGEVNALVTTLSCF